jgi:protein phosphatase 1 regulatory subunit 37
MIEGSALARDVRKEESTRVSRYPRLIDSLALTPSLQPRVQSESETILTAQSIKAEIERALQTSSGLSPSLDSPISRPPTVDTMLLEQARSVLPALAAMIQASDDPHRLEEMLLLNDALTELIDQAQRLGERPVRPSVITNGHANGGHGHSDLDKRTASPVPLVLSTPSILLSPRGVPDPEDDDTPTTPRVDKGKGKAVEPPPGVNSDHEERGKIIPESGPLADVAVEDGELVLLSAGSPTDSRYAWCSFLAHS